MFHGICERLKRGANNRENQALCFSNPCASVIREKSLHRVIYASYKYVNNILENFCAYFLIQIGLNRAT